MLEKSAGKSVHGPKTKNYIFIDRMEVDSYVQSYSAHNKSGGVDKVTFITLLASFTGECFGRLAMAF